MRRTRRSSEVFSTATRTYFDRLPELPGLDAATARRILSSAYADVLAARDGFSREAGPAAPEVISFLRRLTAALEAHAVFPDDVGAEERRGAAFIAAESLSLTQKRDENGDAAGADEAPPPDEEDDSADATYRLLQPPVFEAVEAALLYVVSGLETNARLLLSDIPAAAGEVDTAEAVAGEDALVALTAFIDLGLAPAAAAQAFVVPAGAPLASTIRGTALSRIAGAARAHLRWLRGGDEAEWEAANAQLRESVAILVDAGARRYADVLHLSRLLLRAIEETTLRAIRRLPAPANDRYAEYLAARSLSRPLIWPSGVDYARQCLPGPQRHAAVALPTGSGKSFIAELAVSQAVLNGWALYLVPTNALAVQVRRDLSQALSSLAETTVRAFVGGTEYTELAGETIADVELGAVIVMTPEKCALALRRSPEAFQTLRLCVFDECHLISEGGGRGVIAELVAAHILAASPDVRFLLLSAMVENPEAATSWLEAATGVEALAVKTPWRPTRTLRGVLGFERNALRAAYEGAPGAFANLPANRRNLRIEIPYAALINLQGAWTDLADIEYALLQLDFAGELTLRRNHTGATWNYDVYDDGYLNVTLADVASVLADRGERVLAFVPRNRHHAFSVAANVSGEDVELSASADGRLVSAYLRLAEFEMGAPTVLNDLIRRGVSVHSSALLDAERSASELAFQRGLARVMVATGTLAQGLNLPATVVLVGGTEIGFSATPEPDAAARGRAQLLNAIGRSGRPGVANHGLALVIPNNAISFETQNLNIPEAFQRAEVLAYEDASVPLVSRLGSLVTSALEGSLVGGAMSTDEMVAYTYLPEADVQDALAQRILQRSYGVWQARPDSVQDAAAAVVHALQGVGQEFVAGADAPRWTTEVAYRSGLALPDVFMLYGAAAVHLGEAPPDDIEQWLVLLITVLQSMPLQRAQALVFGDLSLKGLSFSALNDDTVPPPDAWAAFQETVLMYMRGETIASIASFATQTEPPIDQARTVGSKPIPKTLSLIQQVAYRLSLAAGGLAALWVEQSGYSTPIVVFTSRSSCSFIAGRRREGRPHAPPVSARCASRRECGYPHPRRPGSDTAMRPP
jgi:hypothetical protein